MKRGPVRVYATGDPFTGLLTKGHLEAEGIAVLMKGGGGGRAAAALTVVDVPYRFEYCGAFRAFLSPYLRRSFSRASRRR